MRGRMCVVLICNVCVRVGVQVEYSAINLAYAYATTSGVMRKAAILRHAAGREDRGMECAGGVEYQRARVAILQASDGVVATMVRRIQCP